MDKNEMLEKGWDHITKWCLANEVDRPRIKVYPDGRPTFAVCAYYRDNVIHIWPKACAYIGLAGRAWSAPGHTVDRTPYGVLAHELGHHVEGAHGARGGKVASLWRRLTGAKPLTSYCPNDNEWFAEYFRLFVTNPDLLHALAPEVHELMLKQWSTPVEIRSWKEVLRPYPRQRDVIENKLRKISHFQGRLL